MEEKGKVIPFRDWPESERPRERLFRFGVESLSDADLISIFLRSGRPGVNVRELSMSLMKSSEGLSGLVRCSPHELLKFPGLGPAKVAALSAAFEIGNRVLAERIKRRPVIDSAVHVYELLQHSLCGEREEIFKALLLNARNEVVRVITIARGDPTQVLVSIPQVLRQLLIEACAAVIFVHNHPSGDSTPSKEDRKLTRRLLEACLAVEITVHDHIVLGSRDFFSFAEEGLI